MNNFDILSGLLLASIVLRSLGYPSVARRRFGFTGWKESKGGKTFLRLLQVASARGNFGGTIPGGKETTRGLTCESERKAGNSHSSLALSKMKEGTRASSCRGISSSHPANGWRCRQTSGSPTSAGEEVRRVF
jgi:hypothetical protein